MSAVRHEVTNEDLAADWLCDVSESRYVEMVDEWFRKNPAIADRFFAEMVVPAWERTA